MEILNNKDLGRGLTKEEISAMLELAKPIKNDIFYDLGSGDGNIVRAILRFNVRKSNGIESNFNRFKKSVRLARKLRRAQLRNIELWCADFTKYNFSDATLVFNGFPEDENEVEMYNTQFEKKRMRIIKTDLPLVSYKPVKTSFKIKDMPFFLMNTPLSKYKIYSKNKWASSFLGEGKTIKDVYAYYEKLLQNRGVKSRDRKEFLNDLNNLVKIRFKD